MRVHFLFTQSVMVKVFAALRKRSQDVNLHIWLLHCVSCPCFYILNVSEILQPDAASPDPSHLPGGCKWIRTPAIVYSTHVATTLIPILAHILFHQFPVKPHPGPQTNRERWLLASIYAPYLLVPVVLLLTMLLSSKYNPTSKPGSTSGKAKKKNWIQHKTL